MTRSRKQATSTTWYPGCLVSARSFCLRASVSVIATQILNNERWAWAHWKITEICQQLLVDARKQASNKSSWCLVSASAERHSFCLSASADPAQILNDECWVRTHSIISEIYQQFIVDSRERKQVTTLTGWTICLVRECAFFWAERHRICQSASIEKNCHSASASAAQILNDERWVQVGSGARM